MCAEKGAALPIRHILPLLAVIAGLTLACGDDDSSGISVTISDREAAIGGPSLQQRASPSATASNADRADTPIRRASYLADSYIVSFYGHPGIVEMGVLGEASPEVMAERLEEQAAAYQALAPQARVIPAFHLIAAVAQRDPQADGSYLRRMEEQDIERYLQVARQHGFLVFLDLQIGHSSVAAEVERVRRFLEEPDVHLALDPEFTMPPGEIPGVDLGTMSGDQINQAQFILDEVVRAYNIPNKVLIVHEFQSGMITGKDAVWDMSTVDLVYDADGFGPQAGKLAKYDQLIAEGPTRFAGIKLFYRHDPDLFTPAQILDLAPQPSVVIYQ